MRTVLSVSMLIAALGLVPGAGAVDWLDDGNRDRDGAAEPDSWVNPETGVVGTFTGSQVYPDADGRSCREYAVEATIGGQPQQIFGLACLGPDGQWQEASTSYRPPAQASAPPPPRAPTYADLWAPYYGGSYYADAPYAYPYRAYPYRGWDWWYPYATFGLSASYCVDGFCFGGSTAYPGYARPYYPYRYPRYYGYSSWWYPFGLSFSYYGHGHHGHKHYGKHYRKYKRPYYRRYGYRGGYDRPKHHRRNKWERRRRR